MLVKITCITIIQPVNFKSKYCKWMFILCIFTQLTANGKSGPVGLHVLSVVVMDKGQGHDHV